MSRAVRSENVAGKILAARRTLRRTDWDGSDLDQFVQVLCRLNAERHGFDALDLHDVEAAWIGAVDETWSGGLVARLNDGRRAHVEGRAGASHCSDEDSGIEAGLLEAGEQHPKIGARLGWQGHTWDDAMARRLNELLDRVDP